MTKPQATTANKIQIIKWDKSSLLTQEEAEARLHQEGYDCYRWHDVSEASYPRHKHPYDECLWILKGDIQFTFDDQVHQLQSGDRIYLPAFMPHSVYVPNINGVTYLVGQKFL